MIRKIIIVVLTLGAVGAAAVFPISLLSEDGPAKLHWTAPAERLELDDQVLSVRAEYTLAIYARSKHQIPRVSIRCTRYTATWEGKLRRSFGLFGFGYGYLVRNALFSRVMSSVRVPFWFLSAAFATYPLLVVIRGSLPNFRRRTRILLAAIFATLATLMAHDIAWEFRFHVASGWILLLTLVLALYGVLRFAASLSTRNVSNLRDVRVKRWILVVTGVTAQILLTGLWIGAIARLRYEYFRPNTELAQFALTHFLVSILSAAWFMSIVRKKERLLKGACSRCGYDLTGNESGVCPECGTEIEADRKPASN